jgi:hypothetical protein
LILVDLLVNADDPEYAAIERDGLIEVAHRNTHVVNASKEAVTLHAFMVVSRRRHGD